MSSARRSWPSRKRILPPIAAWPEIRATRPSHLSYTSCHDGEPPSALRAVAALDLRVSKLPLTRRSRTCSMTCWQAYGSRSMDGFGLRRGSRSLAISRLLASNVNAARDRFAWSRDPAGRPRSLGPLWSSLLFFLNCLYKVDGL